MIPVRLKLSNFTSYGENPPELDFTIFHMAAISGQNGAGKSSLLDSVTWCIWGSSRAGDSADDLIRLGQTEMYVEFSFELDGHIFTVKRHRSKKSGGHTNLEFWSNSHNLTEGTIKATQQKIIDTLHLSFETFTNSAFLRQGHADEFTTKGPTDRKRILADILGLDHYDKLEEKAKDKAREAQTKLTLLDYQMLEIEAELSQKEEREKSLNLATAEANQTEKELLEVEKLIKTIQQQSSLVASRVKLLDEKKAHLETIQKELEDIKLKISLKEHAQNEYQTLLEQKETIEKNYQKLQELEEEKKVLDTKRTELIKVKDELVEIQKVLQEREDKRKDAIAEVGFQLKEVQTKNEALTAQNEQLKARKDVCPTCGQPIGEEKNKQIIAENEKEISANSQKIAELEGKIEKYKSIKLPEYEKTAEKEAHIKRLEEETKTYFELTNQIRELEKYSGLYLKVQQAQTAVKTHSDAILDLQKMYVEREKRVEESKKDLEDLDKYQKQLEEIGLELGAKEQIKEELSRKAAEAASRVGEAKTLVSRTQQLEDLFEKRRVEKTGLTQQKEAYEELALAFGKKGIQAMIIEQAIPEIEEETNRLLEKLTEGRMKISLETQKETKTKVQTAEGKVHATVETLDIIISDEMGERPYELYSGGETFRVNFALRLAISKLLTHRAGAKLQFLVIDEGFGTQDAPGRARLVEVLDAIKFDFEKIVIITHLEELKEEFPTRIEVSKNSAGSTFEIIGT